MVKCMRGVCDEIKGAAHVTRVAPTSTSDEVMRGGEGDVASYRAAREENARII